MVALLTGLYQQMRRNQKTVFESEGFVEEARRPQ
jgi:hypothetical protein